MYSNNRILLITRFDDPSSNFQMTILQHLEARVAICIALSEKFIHELFPTCSIVLHQTKSKYCSGSCDN